MHNLHISHGDIHPRNMLLHESRIMFCDLGQSTVDALSGAYEQDLSMLDEVVQATQQAKGLRILPNTAACAGLAITVHVS